MTPLKPLPSELINLTVEGYLPKHNRCTYIIYVVVVFAVILLLIALPFLFVDVGVRSTGVLRAMSEISNVKAVSSGFVRRVHIKENDVVQPGQVLFSVQSLVLDENEKYLKEKTEEARSFLRDLRQLARSDFFETGRIPTLMTPLYLQSILDCRQKMAERQTRYKKIKRDFDRNRKLYEEQVIASADIENIKFELDKAANDLDLLKQTQRSVWQQDLQTYQKEAAEYQNQLAQTQLEKEGLNIKASVAGTIQNLAGVYPGSPVFANQDLAQISPDAGLVAEIYVSPRDIGLLRPGMNVRLQVNAFNHSQSGVLSAKVKDISNDVQMINAQAVFEVRCILHSDHLTLRNGYRGILKKGMTVQAHFIVARRSLWQLLYTKVDNWIDPDFSEQTSQK